jgi:hypothetical protein
MVGLVQQIVIYGEFLLLDFDDGWVHVLDSKNNCTLILFSHYQFQYAYID